MLPILEPLTSRIATWWQWMGRYLWNGHGNGHRAMLTPDVDIADDDVTLDEPVDPDPVQAPAVAIENSRHEDPSREVTWHLRTTILDRLDEYFVCIRRLRRYDEDSYELFSRIGFAIPADLYINPRAETNQERLRQAPRISFGGVLLGGIEAKEKLVPSFVYFHKYRNIGSVQTVTDGTIYSLTELIDERRAAERWRSRFTIPLRCHVCLTTDGTVRLLKERQQFSSAIVSKRRNGRRENFTLTTTRWAYPEWVKDLEADGGPKHWSRPEIFTMAMLTYLSATSRIVVRAAHGNTIAAFGIDVGRAKYFFADREIELAHDGRRKRIFHSVVEHTRTLSTERTTTVKQHYRGMRHFHWKSYQVRIVLPTSNDVLKFDGDARLMEDIPRKERPLFVDSTATGTMFDEALSR